MIRGTYHGGLRSKNHLCFGRIGGGVGREGGRRCREGGREGGGVICGEGTGTHPLMGMLVKGEEKGLRLHLLPLTLPPTML